MNNDYLSNDTIAAISTPEGEGGIAVIRISGPESINILKKIIPHNTREIEERKLHYGKIINPSNNSQIDNVLTAVMKAPKSYTGEDVVEIYSHGGHILPKKIMHILNNLGARVASPGEFTKRAFINGKMDLTQAEAVATIITAQSESSLIQAEMQLSGDLSEKINSFKDETLNIYAEVEAQIDFPEEDINPMVKSDLKIKSYELLKNIRTLLNSYDMGKIIKNGVITAIIGKPNVGKSSLLNLLLKQDRAIVSSVPGTTRDFIEENININGIILRLIDTAGIRQTSDDIEKIGVDRTLSKIKQAEFVILVLDGSNDLDHTDENIILKIKDKNKIAVVNKKDLGLKVKDEVLAKFFQKDQIVYMSANRGSGYEDLCDNISNTLIGKKNLSDSSELYLTELRHKDALLKSFEHLNNFYDLIDGNESLEILSMELRSSLDCLGQITGEVTNEDLLGKIFSKFCIGK